MPRYFFHTADGVRDQDSDGVELASDHAAKIEAVRYVGACLADDPTLLIRDDLMVEVTNGDGLILFMVLAIEIDGAVGTPDAPEERGDGIE